MRVSFLILIITLWMHPPIRAQETGELRIEVRKGTGEALGQATIEIKAIDRSYLSFEKTDEQGEFVATALRAKEYRLTATAPGDGDSVWAGMVPKVNVRPSPAKSRVQIVAQHSGELGAIVNPGQAYVIIRVSRILLAPSLAFPRSPAGNQAGGGPSLTADGKYPFGGVVLGPQGAVRAVISVRELQAQAVYAEARTERDGTYRLTLEPGGTYVWTVEVPGLQPAVLIVRVPADNSQAVVAKNVSGDNADLARIRLTEFGAAEQFDRIDVDPAATVYSRFFSLNSPEATVYPLNGGRSPDDLALLFPGVAPAPESAGKTGPSFGPTIGTAGSFSSNGVRPRGNNFTVDGSDDNDEEVGIRRQGFVIPFSQSLESIQEFQVIAALPDAQFGRNVGAQVNVLSKFGGAGFHGTLYGLATAAPLHARDFFDGAVSAYPRDFQQRIPVTTDGSLDGDRVWLLASPVLGRWSQDNVVGGKDSFTRAQQGFALGGTLLPRKLFFYASFHDFRSNGSKESHFAVPAVRERGMFASGATGIDFSDGKRRPTTLVGDTYLSLYPLPNDPLGPYAANTFTQVLSTRARGDLGSFKLSSQFDTRQFGEHAWTARYNITDEESTLPVTGGGLYSSLKPDIQTYNAAAEITSTFSPSAVNSLRLSLARTAASFGRDRPPGIAAPSDPALRNDTFLLNAQLIANLTGDPIARDFNLGGQPFYLAFIGPDRNPIFIDQLPGAVGQIGYLSIAGYSPVGVDPFHFPQERAHRTFQLSDAINFRTARHSFRVGADMIRLNLGSRIERNARPAVFFHGLRRIPEAGLPPGEQCIQGGTICTIPGSPFPPAPGDTFSAVSLASAGIPAAVFHTLATTDDFGLRLRRTQWDVFAQDEISALPNLRLTFGARFSNRQLPSDVNNRFRSGFDTAALERQLEETRTATDSNGTPVCLDRCQGFLGVLENSLPGDFEGTFGADRITADFRVGVVWGPDFLGRRLVFRAGAGKYTSSFPAIIVNESRAPFPSYLQLNSARTFLGSSSFITSLLRQGSLSVLRDPDANLIRLVAIDLERFGTSLVLNRPERNLRNPRAQHYSAGMDWRTTGSSVLSLAYVATLGSRLYRTSTPGLGPHRSKLRYLGLLPFPPGTGLADYSPAIWTALPGTESNSSFLRNNPTAAVTPIVFSSTAKSEYHSLQARFTQNYAKGVYLSSAFTYSHAIDDASDFFDLSGAFALPQSSVAPSERGSSSFDTRLRSVSHFVWDLPIFANRGVLGGWRIAGIYTAQGGQPFTVNSAVDNNLDGNLTDRPNFTDGISRSPLPDDRSVQLRLNANPEELLAPAGQDGAVGRNAFRAPALLNLDLALVKTFKFESTRWEFRFETFNVFNRAHFGIPVRILEQPAFGRSVQTISPARQIQFGLKLHF